MNKLNNESSPLLHIYPQKTPADDVVIVGSNTALKRLKDAIDNALDKGDSGCTAITTDFGTYDIKIILNDEGRQSDFWRLLQLPFFEVDEKEDQDVLAVEDIIGYDIKNSEDLRKAKPVMEEYRKHSQEMTEKIRQIARRNKKTRE